MVESKLHHLLTCEQIWSFISSFSHVIYVKHFKNSIRYVLKVSRKHFHLFTCHLILTTNPHSRYYCYSCSVTQSCPTLLRHHDCSPPGSFVLGISQARILEWVAISFSRGSSRLGDCTHISCVGRWIFYHWATWEALLSDTHALLEFPSHLK